jgi:hypothetical protein
VPCAPLRARVAALKDSGSSQEARTHKPNHHVLTWAFALAVNTIATWQIYRAQFLSRFDLFPGPRGDTRLTVYLVEHWYEALSGHATLFSPAMFYPVKGTLGYTDVLIAYVLPYSPLRMAGLDFFSALAIAVVVLNYLNFILCFILLNNVLKFGSLAASAGAMFFAFNSPRLAQSDHLQLQPLLFLLLCVICFMIFARNTATLCQKRALGLLCLSGVFLNLQLLTSFYIGWFFVFWSFLFLGLSFIISTSRLYIIAVSKKFWPAFTGAGLVFCLGFTFFLCIYLPTASSTGWFGFSGEYIPEIRSYLLMADGNYVWRNVTAFLVQQASNGPDWGRRVGIGLIPSLTWVGLSIVALLFLRKNSKVRSAERDGQMNDLDSARIVPLFLAIMILASDVLIVLGLQYRGHSLWKFVYWSFPGGRSIRAVARYVLVLALPMAIAFAFALHHGIARIAAKKNALLRVGLAAAMLIATVFGLFEQFNSGQGQFSIAAENARLKNLAARLPTDCAVFYVAAGADSRNTDSFQNQNYMHDAMLVSSLRNIPTLNGRSGRNPPGWSLRDVRAVDYEENVRQWIQRHHIEGNICRLVIND